MPLILSAKDIEPLVDMREAISAIEEGFKEYSDGQHDIPPRVNILAPERKGRFVLLPCYLAKSGIFHTKIFSVYLQNQRKVLPNNYYYYILHDIEVGSVKAIMGGTKLTNIRTGAVQAVATKYLARKDSKVLAIFGAGIVAEYQVEGITKVASLERIFVFDSDRARADQFASRLSPKHGLPIHVARSARDAVVKADIIITATSSLTPVFNGNDVKPGCHINAIGGINPNGREIDDLTIANSKVIVERKEEALKEAGDIIIPLRDGVLKDDDIHELAEVVSGKIPGREREHERTFFKSVGFGLEDAIIANLVYEKAIKMGLGHDIVI